MLIYDLSQLQFHISNFVSEFWKFISTPTIFITIVIFMFLLNFRDQISKMIPEISEFGYKNGGLYAMVNSKQNK